MLPTIRLNIERWKYNPTFELYVSNMGHIRNKSKADIAPKILQGGYCVVYVYGSLNKYMLLHRVVMLTWKPTPEAEELTVDHLDHNKRNNALSNLEWVTKEENLYRAKGDYVAGEVLGDEVVINEKAEKRKEKAASEKAVGKRKVAPEDIAFFHLHYASNKKKINLAIKPDLSDFDEKIAPFLGKINNFTADGVRNILINMLNGRNVTATKQYCNCHIKAVYTDGAYKDGTICNLQFS